MIGQGLSLEQSPPVNSSFRFFLTGPIFAILGAIVFLVSGPEILTSRWSAGTIALTHFFTLGFIAIIMFGALFQMLPVLAGVVYPKPVLTSSVIHSSFVAGILLFTFALFFNVAALISLGASLILFAILSFSLLTLKALFKVEDNNATVKSIRFSLLSLLSALTLGFSLTIIYQSFYPGQLSIIPNRLSLYSIHLGWAFLGWIAILIIGVAYQVIPMFYITPGYSRKIQKFLSPSIILSLLLYTFIKLYKILPSSILSYFEILLFLPLIVFSITTLKLIYKRKKKLPDSSIQFWQTGLVSLLVGIILLVLQLLPYFTSLIAEYSEILSILTGVILIYGFVISVISGMLYKIIPFLIWYHLFSSGIPGVPNMKAIISEKKAKKHFYIFIVSLFAIILAVILPEIFFYPAGILLLLNFTLQSYNLFFALALFLKLSKTKA